MTTQASSPENATEPLPCPFCGGAAKTSLYGSESLFAIQCQKCPAEMRGFDQSSGDAINAWNVRILAQCAPGIEALEAIRNLSGHDKVLFAGASHAIFARMADIHQIADAALSAVTSTNGGGT